LNVNKLIHFADYYAPVDAESGRGDQSVTYPTKTGDMYCAIEPLNARELIWARQYRADLTHKITMRYNASINHRFRLLWNSRWFELGPPIAQEERTEQMIFTACEIL